jgi:hypothetical protein
VVQKLHQEHYNAYFEEVAVELSLSHILGKNQVDCPDDVAHHENDQH